MVSTDDEIVCSIVFYINKYLNPNRLIFLTKVTSVLHAVGGLCCSRWGFSKRAEGTFWLHLMQRARVFFAILFDNVCPPVI